MYGFEREGPTLYDLAMSNESGKTQAYLGPTDHGTGSTPLLHQLRSTADWIDVSQVAYPVYIQQRLLLSQWALYASHLGVLFCDLLCQPGSRGS